MTRSFVIRLAISERERNAHTWMDNQDMSIRDPPIAIRRHNRLHSPLQGSRQNLFHSTPRCIMVLIMSAAALIMSLAVPMKAVGPVVQIPNGVA